MVKIATSILSIDKEKLEDEIKDINLSGTDFIHLDVMDGKFVPNQTDGKFMLEKSLKYAPNIFLDTHLMVENPKEVLKEYLASKTITFHIEAVKDKKEILNIIHFLHENEIRVGIAIKPATPLEVLTDYLELIDQVLVMTVEPGYGGQKMMMSCLEKVRKIRNLKCNLDIEVDGGINLENISLVKESGANIIVAGIAIVKAEDKKKVIQKMRLGDVL